VRVAISEIHPDPIFGPSPASEDIVLCQIPG
jgi:hypothetical protein